MDIEITSRETSDKETWQVESWESRIETEMPTLNVQRIPNIF